MEQWDGGLAASHGQPSTPTANRLQLPAYLWKQLQSSRPPAALCECYRITVSMVSFRNMRQLETQNRQEGGRYYLTAFEYPLS